MGIHSVYMITNLVNGKIYIGKTNNPQKRRLEHYRLSSAHTYYLYRSMKKHGVENFSFEVFEEHETEAEALEAEVFWIAYYKSIGAQLMNMTAGGEGTSGYKHTDETRKKISAALTIRPLKQETRDKLIALKPNRPLIAIKGDIRRRFRSINEAARSLAIPANKVCACLNKRRKSTHGYSFVDDLD